MVWRTYARVEDATDDATALFVIDEDDRNGAEMLRFARDASEAGDSRHASREDAMRAAEAECGARLVWRALPRWLSDDSDDLLRVLLPTIDEEDLDEDAWG